MGSLWGQLAQFLENASQLDLRDKVVKESWKTIFTDSSAFALWSPPVGDLEKYLSASFCVYQEWQNVPELKKAVEAELSLWPKIFTSKKKVEFEQMLKEYRVRQDNSRKILDQLEWAKAEKIQIHEEYKKTLESQGIVHVIQLSCDCTIEGSINLCDKNHKLLAKEYSIILPEGKLNANSGCIYLNGIEYLLEPDLSLKLAVPPSWYKVQIVLTYADPDWKAKRWIGPYRLDVYLWPKVIER